jgi:threonine/homoserine/homoserine lactone efflux protein
LILDLHTLLIFIPAALALNLTPGADLLFCFGQGLRAGRKAGIAASLGIATGSFIHTLLAGLGLAVLIASHPVAFEIIRWAGVAYLVWLAVGALRQPLGNLQPAAVTQGGIFNAWRAGIVVCLLNPKVAIFVLSFLPQFVDPAKGSTFMQFMILGAIFNIGGTVVNALVGSFAGSLGHLLASSRKVGRAVQVASSMVFFGLAARIAFDRR